MLRRRHKDNPPGDRKLRRQAKFSRKKNRPFNWSEAPPYWPVTLAAVAACWAVGRPAPSPDAAFQQLRSLIGRLGEKGRRGDRGSYSFRVIAGNKTVLETGKHGDREEMLSLSSGWRFHRATALLPDQQPAADARDACGREGEATGFRISRSRQFA
jgi:hypothetical protein